jgi:uncharacterized protein with ParB-like and HNH nuclease domain
MRIELHEIKVREVALNYIDNAEEGVSGYSGKLNIRPKYQREFVYDEKKRNAVIDTIRKGFPLNVMYWVKNNDGTFEVLDGQQRTISFCQFVHDDFAINADGHIKKFGNMTTTEQNAILDYKLMIYFCEGDDKEKLEWFKTINIAGERLTDQELRNAVYTGEWLTNAKSIFSKSNCAAYLLAKDYVNGTAIRQEILETALSWISKGNIEKYMSAHQHDKNANELWAYFKGIIEWARATFQTYRKEMKGLDWGKLYDTYKDQKLDPNKLENEIKTLYCNDEITNQKGIYLYVLTRDEKHLNIREFTENQRNTVYERQNRTCADCHKPFAIKDLEAHHVTAWNAGGKTEINNCVMVCQKCHTKRHS